jgi:NTE family protein
MTNALFSGPTGLVLSAGGERVVAWQIGVLAGLADAGHEPRGAARIVGTSAGSLVAARLAYGLDPRQDADRLAAAPAPPPSISASTTSRAVTRLLGAWRVPGDETERRRRVGAAALAADRGDGEAHVTATARLLPSGGWPDALRVVTIDACTGARLVLGPADRVDVARAVAASRAVPLLIDPVCVAGRRCIDGALGSATHADVATGTRVLVIDPNGGDEPLARIWGAALADEIDALRRRGVHVDVVGADAAARAAMGPHVMSGAGAPEAVAAGRAAGCAWARRLEAVAA